MTKECIQLINISIIPINIIKCTKHNTVNIIIDSIISVFTPFPSLIYNRDFFLKNFYELEIHINNKTFKVGEKGNISNENYLITWYFRYQFYMEKEKSSMQDFVFTKMLTIKLGKTSLFGLVGPSIPYEISEKIYVILGLPSPDINCYTLLLRLHKQEIISQSLIDMYYKLPPLVFLDLYGITFDILHSGMYIYAFHSILIIQLVLDISIMNKLILPSHEKTFIQKWIHALCCSD
jgi:hypothetical protein